VKVGVIGCGVISRAYVQNATAFDSFELVACADLDPAQSIALAKASGLRTATVPDLIADDSIDMILNLTPAPVHASVIADALAAGKHVYTEKPVATEVADSLALITEAERRNLRIGCAPDIFLGAAYQAGRAVIDQGLIGEPLSVSAAMLAGNQQTWHPNPDIFYTDGAGPLFDMGPYYLTAIAALLGPIARVAGFATTSRRVRTIEIGPRAGERFIASTPTHTTSVMELESGVLANLVASFDTSGLYVCDLTIHGSEGVLVLPDPNAFEGTVRLKRGRGGWEDVPYAPRGALDARGIGLHDMVEAIGEGRPHRASGLLGAHVVEVVRGILEAASEGRTVEIESRVTVPAAMPVDAATAATDVARS
jgi:predicted dehydrogenase